MRKGSKVPYKPKKYNITKDDLVKYYIDNKMTCHQVAEIYGCSWSTILEALKRLNVPVRKPLSGKELAKKYGHQTRFKDGHESLIIRKDKVKSGDGYIYCLAEDHPNATGTGHVKEHRLVMEKHIGRYLTKEEVVHHINEIKDDNRIENLLLCANRAEHNGYHKNKKENT